MPGTRSSRTQGLRQDQWRPLVGPVGEPGIGGPVRSMVVAVIGYALVLSMWWPSWPPSSWLPSSWLPSSLLPPALPSPFPATPPAARPVHRVEVMVSGPGSGLAPGVGRLVVLSGRPSVGTALAAAGIQLLPGQVLAAGSHRAIAHHELPPTVLLDGRRATPGTVMVGARHLLQVVVTPDMVEAVVAKPETALPAPPGPRVLHFLWHPGSPGRAGVTMVGELSGEVVGSQTVISPSSPAPVTEKLVALTFDDGPWPDTGQFLAVLQATGVKATFCMIGRQVLAHPDWVRAVAAAGMTLCNHTLSHDERLDRADSARVHAEVHGGALALSSVLGTAPTLYRPPGGTLSSTIEDVANAEGEQVMHWSVDPSDYKKPGVDKIVAAVLAQVRPGAIIGLHDGGGDRSQTLAALPLIITALTAQGYGFTTPDAVSAVPLGPAQSHT